MSNNPVYSYRDFMNDEFPFKLEIRKRNAHRQLNIRTHAHEHLQICYIRKGTIQHRINDKSVHLTKGDMFSIPPFLEHTVSYVENHEVELVQVDFMPFFINENMKDLSDIESFIDFAYIEPFISIKEPLPKLNISLNYHLIVEQLLENMETEFTSKQEGYRLAIKADLLKLLVIVGREYKTFIQSKRDKQIISGHRSSFYKTVDFLMTHYMEEFKLDQMADMAAMSPTYYSYIFKVLTGKSFIEYLNDIRIQEARKLLTETDSSITEICLNVGYNHLGHFNKMFKRIVGVTPSHFRKSQ